MRAPVILVASLFVSSLLASPALTQDDAAKPDLGATTQVIMKTSLGDMTIDLYVDKAPITVANFLTYAKDDYYNGTIFHRIIKDFMAQGGGMVEGYVPKPPRGMIANEANNGLKNERLTLAMARQNGAHTASSQFFINDGNNAMLNHTNTASDRAWGYCVFGKVVGGADTYEKIINAEVKLDRRADGQSPAAALETITINEVVIVDMKAAEKAIAAAELAREARLAAIMAASKDALQAGIDYVASKDIDVSHGVISESGLWTLDITEGEGRSPGPTDKVKVHYTGWLTDGTKFDSSRDRGEPIEFPLNGVIAGWTEGVGGMKAGGTRYLVIPYGMAYGESGRPPVIPAKATLVFEVELLSF
ncbi:MAG: FKBP-type peptidyl-prolyl cis-trans isomerase [Pseudohongiellaceae bacterium]|jgi:FKBP-type peptidyl-prolyl cis-trans isomerase